MEFLLKAHRNATAAGSSSSNFCCWRCSCLLIILAVLMVSRFTGCTRSYFMQEGLHIVVLDDTLSMTDQWKEGGQDKNSFKAAKDDVIMTNIVKKVAQSTTNERMIILPLSELVKSTAGGWFQRRPGLEIAGLPEVGRARDLRKRSRMPSIRCSRRSCTPKLPSAWKRPTI